MSITPVWKNTLKGSGNKDEGEGKWEGRRFEEKKEHNKVL